MIKEIELDSDNDIIKFANELKLIVPNINEHGWYKKYIFMQDKNIKNYVKIIDDFIIDDKLNNIIEMVMHIMNNNGFNHIINDFNIKKTSVEFHYANSNNGNCVFPWSGIHNDNCNGTLVNTLICYFDVNCTGGNLAIYDNDENILSKIDVSTKSSNKKIIMFTGDVIHNPLELVNGHRYALSFQIPL